MRSRASKSTACHDVIFTPRIQIEAVSAAIIQVANASQDIARWLYEHSKIKRTRDFKALLAELLKLAFDDRVSHNAIIVGHSNKPHKFANVVLLPNGRRLIVDPAAHEASSINARVVSHLDVRAIRDPLLEQRIVYDDKEDWTPADLNLLQVGRDSRSIFSFFRGYPEACGQYLRNNIAEGQKAISLRQSIRGSPRHAMSATRSWQKWCSL